MTCGLEVLFTKHCLDYKNAVSKLSLQPRTNDAIPLQFTELGISTPPSELQSYRDAFASHIDLQDLDLNKITNGNDLIRILHK